MQDQPEGNFHFIQDKLELKLPKLVILNVSVIDIVDALLSSIFAVTIVKMP